MLTPTQKLTAQSVINFFETNEVLRDYGNVREDATPISTDHNQTKKTAHFIADSNTACEVSHG